MRNSPTYYEVLWFIGFDSFLVAVIAIQVKTRKSSLPLSPCILILSEIISFKTEIQMLFVQKHPSEI